MDFLHNVVGKRYILEIGRHATMKNRGLRPVGPTLERRPHDHLAGSALHTGIDRTGREQTLLLPPRGSILPRAAFPARPSLELRAGLP